MSLEYLLGDHLGSTALTTDANGAKVSEMRYCAASHRDKPWGELRSTWTDAPANTSSAYQLTRYTFTGQYSYLDDPTTSASEGFGLIFYNARWYDPVTGRFAQADSIVPAGAQGYDRYSYAFNNPIRYVDPTGHMADEGEGRGVDGCSEPKYCENGKPRSQEYWKLYRSVWAEINRKFDPYLGGLRPGFPYEGSQVELYDTLAADAYWQNGYDLDLIGSSGQENPMTYDDFLNSDLDAEWVLKFGRPKSYVAEFFLLELDRDFDTQNILNYEPNYLDALMSNHSGQLADAKNSYFDALMNMYGPDLELVWDYMRITISARGPNSN